MNHLQENTTSIIELFNYHRLNLEISKIIMSMSIDASEDNESVSNDNEEDITPIENAFPNLSPIFCNLRPYETKKNPQAINHYHLHYQLLLPVNRKCGL